jgi:phage terminase small subunit
MSEVIISDFERAFAENYVISLRKDLAAIAAGSESETPGIVGWQIYQRAHVKAYIQELLDERTITAKETLKLISDTAQGDMSDYMNPVKRLNVPKVKKGLQELINHLQYEIDIETEFLSVAPNLSADERESSLKIIRYKELEITRYDIELNKNPYAFRVIDGDPELVDEIELDLHAIVADRERGKIKSYKMTKDGVQIEMYPADTAQERMARIHGLFGKDNGQKSNLTLHFDSTDQELGSDVPKD